MRFSPSSAIKGVMVAAIVGTVVIAYADLRREQARALEDFTAQQAERVRGYAEAVRARLDAVRRDLETAADASVHVDGRDAVLERLVQGESAYRELEVSDQGGTLIADAVAAGHPSISASAALSEARRTLLHAGDQPIAISPPLRRETDHAHERLRMFRLRSGAVDVVLLVDLDRLFEGVADASGAQGLTRWLIVDDALRWLTLGPDTDHDAATWREDTHPLPDDVRTLLHAMGQDETGAMLLSRDAAEAVGLGHRLAVAGYASVPNRLGRPWSIAVMTSARRMRDRGRLATWRLVVSTSLAGILVALFGFVTLRQQRRAQQLAEALNLAEATSALRERSAKMIEAIPMGILALDDQQRVTSVNPYLADRGVTAGASLAESLPRASPVEIAAIDEMVRDARSSRAPVEKLGLVLHLDEQQPRHLDAYAIPLGRPLTDVDCFVALHDRTEVRALERSLVRAEKLATIGTLAAGVAHEVGTPLGIISGRAEQLLSRVPSDETGDSARKNLGSIMGQVDKVSKTIRQLLDFARMRPIDAEIVTPAQALQSAAALLEHRFRHAKVSLHVEAPPDVPAVSADPGQLEQVLVNLLMNACDACLPGGNVWVCASSTGTRVTLEVCDDGAGIAPENLPLVLDPFFTTKKRGQGTGLGLSIAADIVKNHGGALEIESIVGEGTTMRIILPRSTSVAQSTSVPA